MKLTKRDIALTRIDISPVQSIYFKGKRYTYKQYLKIRRKNTEDSLDTEKTVKKNHEGLLENHSKKQRVDVVIENYNEWKNSRKS
tara:strand:- start:1299 stop:1553 length:255 start_codon:yes stop_codon:yes gene_type:complete